MENFPHWFKLSKNAEFDDFALLLNRERLTNLPTRVHCYVLVAVANLFAHIPVILHTKSSLLTVYCLVF